MTTKTSKTVSTPTVESLVAKLDAASGAYNAATKRESTAHTQYVEARNATGAALTGLNDAQSTLDSYLEGLRAAAHPSSDWRRQRA